MADDKVEVRDVNFRQVLPWTELFRGFQVALDPKKMVLAAAGIVVMSFGWFILSMMFAPSDKPPERDNEELDRRIKLVEGTAKEGADAKETAAIAEKVAAVRRRFDAEHAAAVKQWDLLRRTAGTGGTLSTLPWEEDRGPNPYLLVTGDRTVPLNARQQVYVLLEPLVKFLRPIKYMLAPEAGFKGTLYFLLVLLWTVATWAFFGGAITRMAAVQLTRKEKIGMSEAVRFAWARYVSFFSAPLFPLLFVTFILVLLIGFGFLHLIPLVGDIIVDGIGWPLVILGGVVMAVILVGLVGWPLMYATISVEGSDSFDALSRSYSYVYQCPWHYLWNCAVAIAYGAGLIFFVGFMGSFMVYLGKWGVSQTPGTQFFDRDPAYLFIYAPESFGWRNLLIEGSPYDDANLATNALDALRWYNKAGALMVSAWIYAAFLLVVGFGYSYFWCASTIIYLLMRRQVDDTDLDEIYLEEDESEDAYSASLPATKGEAPPPSPQAPSFQMVDAPTLRPSSPPPKAETPAPPQEASSAPSPADGAPPLS